MAGCQEQTMYRIPSEFIRQKNTVFGPITVAHVAGGVGGYLASQALGDSPWLLLACVAVGILATTIQVQGIVLYQFVPLAVAYVYRRLSGDVIEPEELPAAVPTSSPLVIRDADGTPLVFQQERN
jgi:hypothetical protein